MSAVANGHEGPQGTPTLEFSIEIEHGGDTDAITQAALLVAVRRALTAREERRSAPSSTWARAGRLEAADGRRIRSLAHMPVVAARASSTVA